MAKITRERGFKMAKQAIKNRKNGISYAETARDLDINQKTLWYWVSIYKSAKGERKRDNKQKDEIPQSLISAMDEELNGDYSTKTEEIDILVFSGSIKNNIRVSVEKPDIENAEKFSFELEKRILKKLKWCFAVKGFKFGS